LPQTVINIHSTKRKTAFTLSLKQQKHFQSETTQKPPHSACTRKQNA